MKRSLRREKPGGNMPVFIVKIDPDTMEDIKKRESVHDDNELALSRSLSQGLYGAGITIMRIDAAEI
jgi:hypothetical protein